MGGKPDSVFAEQLSSCLHSVIMPINGLGEYTVDASCFGQVESGSMDNKSSGEQHRA